MTNDAPKLLPCPFCGGEKMLITTNEFGGFCLTCDSCDAVGPPSEYQPAKMRQEWNTRADQAQAELRAAVDAEREACVEAVDEYKLRADGRAEVSRGVGKFEAADRHEGQSGAAVSIAAAIRARTDTDAQASLDRIIHDTKIEWCNKGYKVGRREARNKALLRAWSIADQNGDVETATALQRIITEDKSDE